MRNACAVVAAGLLALLVVGCREAGTVQAARPYETAAVPTTGCYDAADQAATARWLERAQLVQIDRGVTLLSSDGQRLCRPVTVSAVWYEVRNSSPGHFRVLAYDNPPSVSYDGSTRLLLNVPAELKCHALLVLVHLGEQPLAVQEVPSLSLKGGAGYPGSVGQVAGRVITGRYYSSLSCG